MTGACAKLSPMGTLSREHAPVCNPAAIGFTMFLGLCLGVACAAALAIGSHVANELSNPGVASPSLMGELVLSTVGGLAFGVTATVGASLALWITDRRLLRSRVTQGAIAGIGASLPGLAVLAILGQTATLNVGGAAGILAFVAVSAFTLMCI
jgi:hypothetical protein